MKYNSLIQYCLFLVIILSVNIIGSFFFYRFDLTEDNRYSLSEPTYKMLENLDDVVYVKVYLEGSFPAGFVRLGNATRELLDEFKTIANHNIEYEFINPFEGASETEIRNIKKQLTEKGLKLTTLEVKGQNDISQKAIFPGALLYYKGKEIPVNLLKEQMGMPPEVVLHNSIQELEYEFAHVINNLNKSVKPKVAFIDGHGELPNIEVYDITHTLSEFYDTIRIKINGRLNALEKIDAIVIAQPKTPFSEKDKFIIDQFIMNGGKAIWLIDPINANMDSLFKSNITYGVPLDLNIDDQLFKYGVRLNTNLIADLICSNIPIVTGYTNNQPQQKFYPWMYFPIIFPTTKHVIVNNLNGIKGEFVSSLDTIGVKHVRKNILLYSSKYTKTFNAPIPIDLSMARNESDERYFTNPFQPIAVLLEGVFQSNFKNRVPPEIAKSNDIGFRGESEPTKMIVISDGDLIKNQVQWSTGRAYPLGYDKYTRQTYGNKDFILNAINYLFDNSGVISTRSKEFKLRLLDTKKMGKSYVGIQIGNIAIPISIILGLGMLLFIIRKRQYAR